MLVLVPITATEASFEIEDMKDLVKLWSIHTIDNGSYKLLAHLIAVYLFVIFFFYLMANEYRAYANLRWQHLLSHQHTVTSRTLMVENLPKTITDNQALINHFEKFNFGKVESAYLGLNVTRLEALVRRRCIALLQCEYYLAKWLKNPCKQENYDPNAVDAIVRPTPVTTGEEATMLETGIVQLQLSGRRPTTKTGFLGLFGKKIDLIHQHYQRFLSLDDKVHRIRLQNRKFHTSKTGFVTFTTISAAHTAAQSLHDSKPFKCKSDLAPEPIDLFWPNLSIQYQDQLARSVVVTLLMVLIMLFWGIPISFTASLLSMDRLTRTFPFLNDLKLAAPSVYNMLKASLPTFTTVAFITLTPYLFTALSIVQGHKSISKIERATASKHFLFLLVNVLLVFTVSNSVWKSYSGITNDLTDDISKYSYILAKALSDVAPFFVNYVVLQGIGFFPFQLLQFGPVMYYLWISLFTVTPRDYAQLFTSPVLTDYGWLVGQPLIIFVITLTYSTVCPVILLAGSAYFLLGFFVNQYCLVYVYYRRYESGGLIFPLMFRRCILGLFLLELTMAGQFILKRMSYLALALLPLIMTTVIFAWYLPTAYPHSCKYLPNSMLAPDYPEEESTSDDSGSLTTSSLYPSSSIRSLRFSMLPPPRQPTTSITSPLLSSDGSTSTVEEPREANDYAIATHRHYSANYATPDDYTDYSQSTMVGYYGVLDSSLGTYANPALHGKLPSLWLPTKKV